MIKKQMKRYGRVSRISTMLLLFSLTLTFTALSWIRSVSANSPADFLWTKQANRQDFSGSGVDVVTDSAGNVFVLEVFEWNSSEATDVDVYIAKYDKDGNLLQREIVTSIIEFNNPPEGFAMAIDPNDNVFVTGVSKYLHESEFIIFTSKYNNNLSLLWTDQVNEHTEYDENLSWGIATDSAGDAYITGVFVDTITFGSTQLTSAGCRDIFVVKYSGAGDVLWAERAGGISDDSGKDMATDTDGHVLVTGYFLDEATFGDITLTGSGTFAVKYHSNNGNVFWANRVCDYSSEPSIATDSADNGVVVVFDTMSKYDSNGNLSWSNQLTGVVSLTSVATDSHDNIYVTGRASDMFVGKYDGAGSDQWFQTVNISEASRCWTSAIDIDIEGNIAVTGNFMGTVTFGNTTLTSLDPNNYDVYISKLLNKPPGLGFIRRGVPFLGEDPSTFVDDLTHDVFRFVGVNSRTIIHFDKLEDDDPEGKLSDQLKYAKDMGAKVMRVYLAQEDVKSEQDNNTDVDYDYYEAIAEKLKTFLDIAKTEAPGMRFLIVFTDVIYDPELKMVLKGDVKAYDKIVDDRQYLNANWYKARNQDTKINYEDHYKPFVKYIVAGIVEEEGKEKYSDFEGFKDDPRIFAWEIGNEFTVHPQHGNTSFADDMVEFACKMGCTIQNIDRNHMVSPGFISVHHAIGGNYPDESALREYTNAIYNCDCSELDPELYSDLSQGTTPFDFGSIHAYDNDWSNKGNTGYVWKYDKTGNLIRDEVQTHKQNKDYVWFESEGRDVSDKRPMPYIIGELGFSGANWEENYPYYDGGGVTDDKDIIFTKTKEERGRNTRLVLNKFFDELGADGILQWGFGAYGFPLHDSDPMSMNGRSLSHPGVDGVHIDWSYCPVDWFPDQEEKPDFGLYTTYECKASILENEEAPDLYIKNIELDLSNRVFNVSVWNGGEKATEWMSSTVVKLSVGNWESAGWAWGSIPSGQGIIIQIPVPDKDVAVNSIFLLTYKAIVSNPSEPGKRTCNNEYFQTVRLFGSREER